MLTPIQRSSPRAQDLSALRTTPLTIDPAETVTGTLHGSPWKVQDYLKQQGSNMEQHDLHGGDGRVAPADKLTPRPAFADCTDSGKTCIVLNLRSLHAFRPEQTHTTHAHTVQDASHAMLDPRDGDTLSMCVLLECVTPPHPCPRHDSPPPRRRPLTTRRCQ